MVVTVHPPDLKEFFETVFDGMPDGEYILLARQTSLDGGFQNVPWGGKACSRWFRSNTTGAIFFNVSTVRAPEEGERWCRRKQDCVAAYVVVLDDIGTKVSEHPPVEPSYKMETSKGNFQWGYLIDGYDNLERYAAIIEALGELGFTDKGAGGYNRVMRIPGSVNVKPGRGNFKSTVTEWDPERIFELDRLAVELGVDLNKLVIGKRVKPSRTNGSLPDIDILDPMETWLRDNSHVVEDNGSEFITIKCPWGDKHTTGGDTAGYSPLGRGDGDWVQKRGFKCLHEHCIDRHFSDFRDWAVALGAPDCAGVDPVPWYQHRYIFVAAGKEIADMYQRPRGGVWRYGLEEWSMANYRTINVPGRDRGVLIKTAFLEHPDTRKADAFSYVPGEEGFTETNSQPVVNTYVEPTHPETDELPEIFLEHMKYLLGTYTDLFLDWLAFKIQYPADRSYAVIMVAEEFGTGRSWIKAMLTRVLQGKVNSASLGQLIGKGTSGENNFNDWASSCQFLVIEEAKDNLSPDDFYKGYETFKQRIDNRPVEFRCNPKYGKTRDDLMYFNCLIFTNHSDAMILPPEERRICVLENPSKRKDYDYYERLERSLDSDEPRRVFWYLKRRDISKFDHVYPPDTEAKQKMIEQSRSSFDEVMDMALEKLKGDIVTKKVLSRSVRDAARMLEYSKIENDPGTVTARLWRRIGKLRLDDKNGARYATELGREEFRAVRNAGKWRKVDDRRDLDLFMAELKTNMPTHNLSGNFPQK